VVPEVQYSVNSRHQVGKKRRMVTAAFKKGLVFSWKWL